MTRDELLQEVKLRLQSRHGDRLHGVILYGSEARGESGPDSDIDLLVLLDDPVDYGRDLEANLEALYPLALRLGRRISAKPVSARQYETAECPLYRNTHRQGVVV